jgi:hypothetical protein
LVAQFGPRAKPNELAVPMINTILAARRRGGVLARRLGFEAANAGEVTSSPYSCETSGPGISGLSVVSPGNHCRDSH